MFALKHLKKYQRHHKRLIIIYWSADDVSNLDLKWPTNADCNFVLSCGQNKCVIRCKYAAKTKREIWLFLEIYFPLKTAEIIFLLFKRGLIACEVTNWQHVLNIFCDEELLWLFLDFHIFIYLFCFPVISGIHWGPTRKTLYFIK